MELQRVSFEQAKALSKLNFDWDCNGKVYSNHGNEYRIEDIIEGCNYKHKPFLAPTVSLALKWLRDKKKIHILIYRNLIDEGEFFYARVNTGGSYKSLADVDTYEQAEIDGLNKALDFVLKARGLKK